MTRVHALGLTYRRRSRREGPRALGIVSMFTFLLVGLAACTLFGAGTTTTQVLNIDAPVPGGSGLYYQQFATDNSGGTHFSIVRADAVTGNPQWQQALPGDTPKIAIGDGNVYVLNGLEVMALRGNDGAHIWSTTLHAAVSTQSTNSMPMASGAVVAEGHVYISVLTDYPETFGGQVVALRASDGVQVWSHSFDDIGSLAAGDGFVFMGTGESGTFALHAADGSLAWQAQQLGEVQLVGGLVYIDNAPSPLVALDEHTGELVWTLPCWKQTPIVSDPSGARIYLGCLAPHDATFADGGIFAFDTQQRQLIWKYPQVSDFNTAPVADSDMVFIAEGTALDALRASDGKQVWSQQAEESNAGPVGLVLIGDTLYVRVSIIYPHVIIYDCCKRSYSLSALRTSDGAAFWRHYEPSQDLGLLVA
jgi:outer membrane protein assembly factor BamB